MWVKTVGYVVMLAAVVLFAGWTLMDPTIPKPLVAAVVVGKVSYLTWSFVRGWRDGWRPWRRETW
ncbi:hypothetical protein ACFV0L_14255 [Streptosporangium canum]|uniref:hypothetical protein n=1 Tax=Streptosporangium canum TaxID=324952 RepID=UPI0036926DD1